MRDGPGTKIADLAGASMGSASDIARKQSGPRGAFRTLRRTERVHLYYVVRVDRRKGGPLLRCVLGLPIGALSLFFVPASRK